MADRILANTDTYQQIARRLNILAQELGDAASSLSRVNTDRDAGGKVHVGLGGRLRSTGDSMPDGQIASVVRSMRSVIRSLRDHTGNLADNVREAANLFENVEQELARLEPGTGENAVYSDSATAEKIGKWVKKSFDEFVDLLFGEDGHQGLVINGIPIAECFGDDLAQWVLGPFTGAGVAGLGWSTLLGPGSSADDVLFPLVIDPGALPGGQLSGSHMHGGGGMSFAVDPSSVVDFGFFSEYRFTDYLDGTVADDIKSRLHDSTTVSAEVSGSTSVFSWEGSVSDSHGSAEAHMDFLKAEGEAGASAHLFDEDGNFNPGAEAHAGGSVTIFEAGASAEYEVIDGVKVHTSADVTVGEVSGEAEVNVGFDEDGNFNLNAGASLEAIAVEAKADVGVEIAGVDVKGEVGVNVGIGGHADVGYEDGVVKVDIGASFGIGVEVAFEVDIGGAIDNAKDFVNDGIDNLKGLAESIFGGWNL